jgi:hypothetical protein
MKSPCHVSTRSWLGEYKVIFLLNHSHKHVALSLPPPFIFLLFSSFLYFPLPVAHSSSFSFSFLFFLPSPSPAQQLSLSLYFLFLFFFSPSSLTHQPFSPSLPSSSHLPFPCCLSRTQREIETESEMQRWRVRT